MDFKDWLGEDNQLGLDIVEKKYRRNGESFDQWIDRVSGGDEAVAQLIKEKKFLFGGRILSSRGVPGKHTYSNCYVIAPPEDSIESIYEAAAKLARTYSYGGGCGVDVSKLAPKDARVNNAAKKSSGAVSFMDLYNCTTGLIGQNGRRGALMLSMSVNHPDIEEFIEAKSDLNRLTNANISVRVTDDFMEKVRDGGMHTMSFTRPESGEEISREVPARDLFNKLVEMNWNYAEPGILFWDAIEQKNLLQYDENFEYAGTNPCAEEPLPAGGSCLLGAINLSEFVRDPFSPFSKLDINDLRDAVKTAVIALNDVLDEGLLLHPLEEQRNSVREWRQIGLGVMGLADCLIKLGLTYGSDKACDFCEEIARIIFATALFTSAELGEQLGDYEEFDSVAVSRSDMVKNLGIGNVKHLRNSQLLTIAPTGSISNVFGCSGGLEPIFANSYTRKTQSLHGEDTYYKIYTPIVKAYMDKNEVDEADLPKYFVTAADISPESRVKCQAAWQKWIDASISSTINLPNSATVHDVAQIYMNAWKNGLKGVTVYRAGCAREGVLVTDADKKVTVEEKVEETVLPRGYVIPASDDLIGLKRGLTTGCGSLHLAAFFDRETLELRETYLAKGSTGGCINSLTGLSRMISLSARAGVPFEQIIDQLDSCGACASYATRKATKGDTSPGSCCPAAVGRALKDMYESLHTVEQPKVKVKPVAAKQANGTAKCPQCGEPLLHEGGCDICKNCGYSKCD